MVDPSIQCSLQYHSEAALGLSKHLTYGSNIVIELSLLIANIKLSLKEEFDASLC